MPKFLAGKLTLVTWELEAESKEAAETEIAKAENPLDERPRENVKKTAYKLGWFEFDIHDPTPARNQVLQAFLALMAKIPGMPQVTEGQIILHPFDGKKPTPR